MSDCNPSTGTSATGLGSRRRSALFEFLRLFHDTSNYARPLARERRIALPPLDAVADGRVHDYGVRAAAADLRDALRAESTHGEYPATPTLNVREMDVLLRMEHEQDKEIARVLNLSYEGVRYRVGCIFSKLGVRGRLNAVQRARELGILPTADDTPDGHSL